MAIVPHTTQNINLIYKKTENFLPSSTVRVVLMSAYYNHTTQTQQFPHRKLIRRLTPLECERLQGFPDYWTEIPKCSDSARYKALGNSVAVPCVDFVLRGVALVLEKMYADKTDFYEENNVKE